MRSNIQQTEHQPGVPSRKCCCTQLRPNEWSSPLPPPRPPLIHWLVDICTVISVCKHLISLSNYLVCLVNSVQTLPFYISCQTVIMSNAHQIREITLWLPSLAQHRCPPISNLPRPYVDVHKYLSHHGPMLMSTNIYCTMALIYNVSFSNLALVTLCYYIMGNTTTER